jgi:LysM repeat protein
MVVVHNYSESQNQPAPSSDSLTNDSIDEDRAYVVGIWVVVIVVAIITVLFVLFAIGRNQGSEEIAATSETAKEQVLGKKEAEQAKEAQETKEPEGSKKQGVQYLERPLSEEEIIAKAKEIPGSKLHSVAAGESLYTIGEKYNTNWQTIAETNNLSPPYNLRTGQKLIIPPGKEGLK